MSGDPNDWLYLSGSKDMNKKLVEKLWASGMLLPGEISNQKHREAELSLFRGAPNSVEFDYDLLFTRNAEGKPQLVSFVRFQKGEPPLPKAPRKVKSGKAALEAIKGSLRGLIPQPARR